MKTEAAENSRSKLEALSLHSGVSASDYVNKFMNYYRYLEKIPGEQYSPKYAVTRFLDNISDRNYDNTVSYCRNNNCNLEMCIFKVRMNERNIMRKRTHKLKLRGIVRRMQSERNRDWSDSEEISERPKKVRRLDDSKVKGIILHPGNWNNWSG